MTREQPVSSGSLLLFDSRDCLFMKLNDFKGPAPVEDHKRSTSKLAGLGLENLLLTVSEPFLVNSLL